VDDHFRMRPDALEAAIAEDRRAIAVVASAGTVTTGAIDPLAEVAAIAHANDLWLHVDGAYGALAALAVPERLAGLALADSLSVDAHKWLYQPLDCGALLYRDAEIARQSEKLAAAQDVPMTAKPLAGLDAKPSDPGLEQNPVTHVRPPERDASSS
jgi:aromatic-L-amino-acid decarboxylase